MILICSKTKTVFFCLNSIDLFFACFRVHPVDLLISFNNYEVRTLIRSEKYTYTDFLAICGGLLGLFLGVSTLSIIEFVYYSTLRLYCTVWKSEKSDQLKGIVENDGRNQIKSVKVLPFTESSRSEECIPNKVTMKWTFFYRF